MPNRIFLFIDESGDPGYEKPGSTEYYAELVLSVSADDFPDLNRPILNWRYCRNLIKDMKRAPKKGGSTSLFILPLSELHRMGIINCACVYLIKKDYSGPYLKPESYGGQRPLWFRNFVHRQLLEYYFTCYQVTTDNIEIIFDRFEMSDEETNESEQYLANNWSLPDFKYFTHADSKYVDSLQVVSQLVNLVQEVISKKATFDPKLLDFISIKDITKI